MPDPPQCLFHRSSSGQGVFVVHVQRGTAPALPAYGQGKAGGKGLFLQQPGGRWRSFSSGRQDTVSPAAHRAPRARPSGAGQPGLGPAPVTAMVRSYQTDNKAIALGGFSVIFRLPDRARGWLHPDTCRPPASPVTAAP